MSSSAAITELQIRELVMNTRQLLAEQRRKPVGWIMALFVAVVINLVGVPYIQNNAIPLLTAALETAIEWETEAAIDLGILVVDAVNHVDRAAPPLPQGMSIIGLTTPQAQALIESVRISEAPGYTIINWAGYMGQWQFGAEALVTVGLVKRSAFEAAKRNGTLRGNGGWIGQRQWLVNTNHWNIKGGMEAFLSNRQIQDAAFIRLANLNIQDGFRMRVLSKNTPAHKMAGWVKASHLKGTGAAKKWYKYGRDSKDGNNTRVSYYAGTAERAILALNNQLDQE